LIVIRSGIETVTYIIDGLIEHYYKHGNTGALGGLGDAMWLATGHGVIHNE